MFGFRRTVEEVPGLQRWDDHTATAGYQAFRRTVEEVPELQRWDEDAATGGYQASKRQVYKYTHTHGFLVFNHAVISVRKPCP